MFGRRKDGKLVKNVDPILRVTSAIMPKRYDAMVNYLLEVRNENSVKYIQEQSEKGNSISYFHILIAAIVRMYAERPELNRFVMNTRVYQRNDIQVSFAVKRSLRDGAEETTIKLTFDGTENLFQIKEKIDQAVKENKGANNTKSNSTDKFAKFLIAMPPFILKMAMGLLRFMDRHGMIPKKLLDLSPFHASCFVSSMKSISTEYVYHHIYDFGTVGMFAAIGKEITRPEYDEKGKLEPAQITQIGVVIDERICDGFYYAKSIRLIKKYLLQPWLLEQNYVYPEKELTEKEKKALNKKNKKLMKKQYKMAMKSMKK